MVLSKNRLGFKEPFKNHYFSPMCCVLEGWRIPVSCHTNGETEDDTNG